MPPKSKKGKQKSNRKPKQAPITPGDNPTHQPVTHSPSVPTRQTPTRVPTQRIPQKHGWLSASSRRVTLPRVLCYTMATYDCQHIQCQVLVKVSYMLYNNCIELAYSIYTYMRLCFWFRSDNKHDRIGIQTSPHEGISSGFKSVLKREGWQAYKTMYRIPHQLIGEMA